MQLERDNLDLKKLVMCKPHPFFTKDKLDGVQDIHLLPSSKYSGTFNNAGLIG